MIRWRQRSERETCACGQPRSTKKIGDRLVAGSQQNGAFQRQSNLFNEATSAELVWYLLT
jgi:hypothetical protein